MQGAANPRGIAGADEVAVDLAHLRARNIIHPFPATEVPLDRLEPAVGDESTPETARGEEQIEV